MFKIGSPIILIALLLTCSVALADLQPDQIALIINPREPESRKLAEFYAKERGIPDGRIIEIDLPKGDEIEFDQYERLVVPAVRQFLRQNSLDKKVTCLVTMYGMPLRISGRIPNDIERRETVDLRLELPEIEKQIVPIVQQLEAMVLQTTPDFQHTDGQTLDALGARADNAFLALAGYLQKIRNDPATLTTMLDALEHLAGPIALSERYGNVQLRSRRLRSAERQRWTDLAQASNAAKQELDSLREQRFDQTARQRVRELTKAHLGLFGYARLLEAQMEYLSTDLTGASIDSELSLVWWDYYPRARWVINPLYYRAGTIGNSVPDPLMVMRLDAPTPEIVKRIITDSIRVEKSGLRGRVVLDARGIPLVNGGGERDGYGIYDETIRRLAGLIKSKTQLAMEFDDRPAVLGEGSQKDVALYCGWYSLRKYVASNQLVPGSVGYHIASLEMVNITRPTERGWVRGLLNDGISATLGSVAEPFLHSFPAADEFFPLLLTGKFTLAEVYWKTQTSGSWMVSMIGDPLYRPFAVNPALKVEDIPEPLSQIFAAPTTKPATLPASRALR